ncbi:MAG: hypothetical protein KA807_15235 [Prolixibacteraceae bacterium]|nr:hypothetical protein [Prolixibacteraceae bacterium]
MAAIDNTKFIFQFNNKAKSTNSFVLYIVSGLVLVGLGFLFLAKSWYIPLIIDSLITIVYFYFFSYTKPSFFEVLVTEKEVKINYYSVSSAMRSYNTIEVPLKQLRGYEVKRKLWGLKKELIISMESKYGFADFPPVSITLLSKKELSQIFHVLKKIIDS